jgi:hypothetical protein
VSLPVCEQGDAGVCWSLQQHSSWLHEACLRAHHIHYARCGTALALQLRPVCSAGEHQVRLAWAQLLFWCQDCIKWWAVPDYASSETLPRIRKHVRCANIVTSGGCHLPICNLQTSMVE